MLYNVKICMKAGGIMYKDGDYIKFRYKGKIYLGQICDKGDAGNFNIKYQFRGTDFRVKYNALTIEILKEFK